MTAVAATRQQGAGHVPGELRANAAPGADTAALMLRLIIRLVVDIAETQRAGIEAVFICASCGSNHPAIQLRVAAYSDIKAALTGNIPLCSCTEDQSLVILSRLAFRLPDHDPAPKM